MKVFNIKKYLKNNVFFLTLLLCLGSTILNAQKFNGSVVFGINLAQIDGDDLAGFSKLGWTGGVKLGYPMKKNIDANLEMIYSQRGSNSGFGFGSLGDNFTDLKYLEVPMYGTIKDWFIEDGNYHKVKAHAGLSLSYLFDVKSSNGAVSGDIDTYKRYNFGYLIGIDYAFSSSFGLTVRYTRAFNSILESNAISYFVTIRTEYKF